MEKRARVTKTYTEKYRKGAEFDIKEFRKLLGCNGAILEIRERSVLSDGGESCIVELVIPGGGKNAT